MRFLHTGDWHVGKVLKGHNRLEEQRQVLEELVGVARDHAVDAVLVAGDLYDSTAPTADAQRLVVRTLLALRRTGAEVIAIAGNHDHAPTFDAYRPLMTKAGITVLGRPRPADHGGMITFTARSTGEPVQVAALPFLSQRYVVRAADLVTQTQDEHGQRYQDHIARLLAHYTAAFRDDAVNLVLAHLTVTGGELGGGERKAQSIFEYHVPASVFPSDVHYVALGHLHRRQSLPASCPVHYCGSPLAVDFGEQDYTPMALVVEAGVTTPAAVTEVPITRGRRLRTVRGTVAELAALADQVGDDFLRVYVREPARAGLRDEVQALLPNALEVRIDPEVAPPTTRPAPRAPDRSSAELFAEYCQMRGVSDERLTRLFATLHDQALTTG